MVVTNVPGLVLQSWGFAQLLNSARMLVLMVLILGLVVSSGTCQAVEPLAGPCQASAVVMIDAQ